MGSSGIEAVRGLVEANMRGYEIRSVVPLGAGLDHVAYEVNGELVVRLGTARHEARLLEAVGEISPVPVPDPVFVAERCLAYRKLPGRPLLELPNRVPHSEAIADTLGRVLAALHATPVDRIEELVRTEEEPMSAWQRNAARAFEAAATEIPAPYRPRVEAFLHAPALDQGGAQVFSHNDLGIEHVLVDPARWTVTGIIDWSDAAITDPAYDFGLILRDLGPAALDAAVRSHGHAASFRERSGFYARCMLLEDMAYGLETGQPKYVEKSLAGLEWLFP